MNSKIYIALACVFVVTFARPNPTPDRRSSRDRYDDDDDDYDRYGDDDREYQFWYEVDAEDHYDREVNFGHHEEKDDDGKVSGYYFVLLPDERKLRVDYYVDDYSGFVADVKYEGDPSYSDEYKKSSYESDNYRKSRYGYDDDSYEYK